MIFLGLPAIPGWIGLGLALIAIEVLVAPGSYLLWVGLAAMAMGLVSAFVTLGAGTELALFGLFTLAAALAGVKLYGGRERGKANRELDDPAAGLIGKELQLVSAIENGIGQAKFGDSIWRVAGPDMPAGADVVVRGMEGATLIVTPRGGNRAR